MKLVFQVTPTQRLIIVESALNQMTSFRQNSWWKAEAGGVLLGRHLLDSEDVVVDEVTTPQKSDQRSRFGFFRSKRHSTLAQKRWVEENSTMAYLGLWHTHPEVDPKPSYVDRNDWNNSVAHDTFTGERLFFPIVGIERIRVWTRTRNGALEELKNSL
jgi:integrative and conjugative element protein (TIGR02256 family)